MRDRQYQPLKQTNKGRLCFKDIRSFFKVNKILFYFVLIWSPLPAAEGVQVYNPQVVSYSFNSNTSENICGSVRNSSESYQDGVGQSCTDSICGPWSPRHLNYVQGRPTLPFMGAATILYPNHATAIWY